MKETKTYILKGDIDAETLEKFFHWANEHSGEIVLSLASLGGEAALSRVFIKFLNENKHRITLIAYNTIQSAAFDIFFEFEGTRQIAFGTTGMYHLPYNEMAIMANGKMMYDFDKMKKRNMGIYLAEYTNQAKGFLTAKELRAFRSGKDVYFDFNRMCEIFPLIEII